MPKRDSFSQKFFAICSSCEDYVWSLTDWNQKFKKCFYPKLLWKPFHATGLLLYPLKSEN